MRTVHSFVVKRRIGRLGFAIVGAVLLAVGMVSGGTAVDFFVRPILLTIDVVVGPIFLTIDVVELAFLLAVIYRLHDLGLSGWWVLAVALLSAAMRMFLAPPYRLFEFLVIVGFFSLLRGQPGDDKWGPVP